VKFGKSRDIKVFERSFLVNGSGLIQLPFGLSKAAEGRAGSVFFQRETLEKLFFGPQKRGKKRDLSLANVLSNNQQIFPLFKLP